MMLGLGISCPGDPGCPGGTVNPVLALGPPDVFSTPDTTATAITPTQVVAPIGYDSMGNPIYPSGTTSQQMGVAAGCPFGYMWQASNGGNVLGPNGQQGICNPSSPSLIPGVSNTALGIAAAAFAGLLLFAGGRR